MSAAPLTGEDYIAVARFVRATVARIHSLTIEQRHEDAKRVICGLRRLGNTIRAAQSVHGFMADIVLADSLTAIDEVCADAA